MDDSRTTAGDAHTTAPGQEAHDTRRELVSEQRILEAFSQGKMGREAAMVALGIGYRDLLERIADEELPLYRVPDAEAERMADKMVAVLTAARR